MTENTPERQQSLDEYFNREKRHAEDALRKNLGLGSNTQLPIYEYKEYPRMVYHKNYHGLPRLEDEPNTTFHSKIRADLNRNTRIVNSPDEEAALGSDWSADIKPSEGKSFKK